MGVGPAPAARDPHDALEPLLVPVPMKVVAGEAKEQKAAKKAS